MHLLITFMFLPVTYFVFLYWLRQGSKVISAPPVQSSSNHLPISVVIAVRNEAGNIGRLLSALQGSEYPSMQVIVVDDHSEDETYARAQAFTTDPRFRCFRSPDHGKKKAIAFGVQQSTSLIIATTDGDCAVESNWLYRINDCFQNPEIKMAFGPVAITSDGKIFSDVQSIEFSSLMASSIAMWAHHHPVMCNGANLAFTKAVFEEVKGYEGNVEIPSGDDEFLMRKILKQHPRGMSLIAGIEGIVTTLPKPSLRAFLSQRFRWAGKWKHNDSPMAKWLATYVFLVQLYFLVTMVLIFTPLPDLWKWIAVSILFLRFLTEAMLLIPVCRFMKIRWRWIAYLILQLFYPVYVVFTGLFSNFMPVRWKNRKVI